MFYVNCQSINDLKCEIKYGYHSRKLKKFAWNKKYPEYDSIVDKT